MVAQIWLPSERSNQAKQKALIYHICGNPGLIEYYTDFLSILRGLLDKIGQDTAYDIYGRNLLGFGDDEHEPFSSGNKPWDLNGEIEGIYHDVATKGRGHDSVILMGHSVGSYISVEIFHRHMSHPERAPHLTLRHGILLFPTLTHLAKSPSGVKFTALQRLVPFLDKATPLLARLLLGMLSVATLTWLVQRVLGFTQATAGVTARWLKSRDGVQQAVHLALSELETICEEKWSEELWAATSGGEEGKAPKFFLLYAKTDHWVDDGERNGIIKRRGEGARIVVDNGDIPHAFCTRESESSSYLVCLDGERMLIMVDASLEVARRVSGWIEEIDGGCDGL
ncbi:hypothetical protein F66182_7351 [Fusarium sp. NRRL 66182]|nr:hypothetical protein F66182_7351 [Fusarium sp. NRRL 66182]